MKYIDIIDIDFNCLNTTKVLDLELEKEGNNNPYYIDYSTEINKESIFQAFAFFKAWGITIDVSENDLISLSKYPESFKRVEKK